MHKVKYVKGIVNIYLQGLQPRALDPVVALLGRLSTPVHQGGAGSTPVGQVGWHQGRPLTDASTSFTEFGSQCTFLAAESIKV